MSVAFPTSSPLIKLAIRPKKIPIGDTQAMTSNKNKVDIFLDLEKRYVPKIIPTRAHEKTFLLPKFL